MSRRIRCAACVFAAVALVAGALWWRPWAREEIDDDGPALPDGAVRLGSSAFDFKGGVGPWVVFDGGKKIALANGRRIRIVDVATNAVLLSWVADKRFATAISATHDGRRIASTSGYDQYIRVWDGDTGKLVKQFNPHRGSAGPWLTFTPDGKYLASKGSEREPRSTHDALLRWGDSGVRVCEAETGEEHPAFRGGVAGADGPAFSPDGLSLAWVTSTPTGTRVVLRPLAGGPDRGFDIGTDPQRHLTILPLTFSPDGKLLVTHSTDGRVVVWDVASGTERRRFEPPGKDPTNHNFGFQTARFAPDNNTLAFARATSHGGEWASLLALHDVTAGASRVLARDAPIRNGVEFTPDGKTLFTLRADRNFQKWDVATGKGTAPPGHTSAVWAVALSPDGNGVATAGLDKTVRLWERATGKEQRVLTGHAAGVIGVAYLPGGKALVSADWDGTVMVWDAASGDEAKRFAAHAGGMDGFALSPDGSRLATGGRDRRVRLWDTATWAERKSLTGQPGWPLRLAFTPDGGRLLSAGRSWHRNAKGGDPPADPHFRMWDVATGTPVADFNARRVTGSTGVVLSPDGARAVSHVSERNAGQIQEWELATGRVLREVGPVDKGAAADPLAWSPDGRTVGVTPRYFSDGGGSEILLLDARTWKQVGRLSGHFGWVNAAVFSPDGRFLVSGSDDGSAVVWDLAKLAPTR